MKPPKRKPFSDGRFGDDWTRENLALLGPSPQCGRCIHRHGTTRFCDAFPEGIPAVILGGKFDHTKPFPGDNGIRFEPDNS